MFMIIVVWASGAGELVQHFGYTHDAAGARFQWHTYDWYRYGIRTDMHGIRTTYKELEYHQTASEQSSDSV